MWEVLKMCAGIPKTTPAKKQWTEDRALGVAQGLVCRLHNFVELSPHREIFLLKENFKKSLISKTVMGSLRFELRTSAM
ncbi:MAG TPA: hypothetical protein PLG75_00580, partial [Methanoculleus sp.]|nr:hypothetical protein [Methanoculleus sp.]